MNWALLLRNLHQLSQKKRTLTERPSELIEPEKKKVMYNTNQVSLSVESSSAYLPEEHTDISIQSDIEDNNNGLVCDDTMMGDIVVRDHDYSSDKKKSSQIRQRITNLSDNIQKMNNETISILEKINDNLSDIRDCLTKVDSHLATMSSSINNLAECVMKFIQKQN